jgi:outer membrane lipoprotein-sorting protein
MWFYCVDAYSTQGIFGHGPNATGSIRMFYNFPGYTGKIVVHLAQSGGTIQLTSTTNAPNSAWNHVAIVRNGSTVSLYLNGVNQSSSTSCSIDVTPQILVLFRDYTDLNQEYFSGYITGFRLTKAVVYTSTFTPTNHQYSIDTNTVVAINVSSSGGFLTDSANSPVTFTNNNTISYNSAAP